MLTMRRTYGGFLRGCLVLAMALAGLLLAVSVLLAESSLETFEIENGKVEIRRTNAHIDRIKETRNLPTEDGGNKEVETTWEYDADGNCNKLEYHQKTYGKDTQGKIRLLKEEKTESQYDAKGKLTSFKVNLVEYGLDKNQSWGIIKNETEAITVNWLDSSPLAQSTKRDELTGQERSRLVGPELEELLEPEKPAASRYKEFLNKKREWDLKKQFGQGPAAPKPKPGVPGAPVGPGEYAMAPATSGLAMPDPSFYVGLFGGPSLTSVNGLNADYSDFNAFASLIGKKNLPCASATEMSGGVRFGTWGNWGVAPEWTKYLGFSVDFSYQKLDVKSPMGTYTQTISPFGVMQTGAVNFTSNGSLVTLGFMFNARYGFFPDERISRFGQIQPFLGVGPVLSFASVEPTVYIDGDFVRQFGRQTSVFPGLGVEAGVRYLPHKNIYLETTYRFCYGQPGFDSFKQGNFQYNFNPDITTHTFRFGVGFMF